MRNNYEAPEVVEIGKVEDVIFGSPKEYFVYESPEQSERHNPGGYDDYEHDASTS